MAFGEVNCVDVTGPFTLPTRDKPAVFGGEAYAGEGSSATDDPMEVDDEGSVAAGSGQEESV
ncbi:hypothetical protein BCR44DRAFT_63005 [Catenaria anguillulae PL171]|uniref:Uncharacterized protein n=1 Tax=Catenaria anguillulae PL171 TaxID=765915 RepID=A0A1Y2HT31_9FUNG|nr:hypothetical protein BCR44DRAFT_63005 [Catenaria anguillulae PL171]